MIIGQEIDTFVKIFGLLGKFIDEIFVEDLGLVFWWESIN